jgi:predicted RNase H-like HicB family nuclease
VKLTAIIYPDSETGLLVAECPEIGTASQGHTEEEALSNLQEATDLYLEAFPQTLIYLEAFPQTLKKSAAIRTFELTHG